MKTRDWLFIGVVLAVLVVGLILGAPFRGSPPAEIKGTTNFDAVTVSGALTAGTYVDATTYVHADTSVTADAEVTAGTNVNAGTTVGAGTSITSGTFMSAGSYMASTTYMDATTYIHADGSVTSDAEITAGTSMNAGTSIGAGTSITAATFVDAGTYLDAGSYVNAATYVDAGTYVDVGTWLQLQRAVTVTVTAGSTINPAGSYVGLTAGEPVTTSTTNAITDGTVIGQLLFLTNGSANAITIDNGGQTALPGAADLVLGQNDGVLLVWNGTLWLAVASVNN